MSRNRSHYLTVVEGLEKSNDDAWKRHGQALAAQAAEHERTRAEMPTLVAAGIDASGLPDEVSALRTAMTTMALSLSASLNEIGDQIHTANVRLASLDHATRNPLSVKAGERLRRGLTAFQNGWLPEACTEFTAAAKADPYDPATRYLLGMVHLRLDAPQQAAEAFEAAYRYALPVSRPVAAAAALLGARAHQANGNDTAAAHLLDQAHQAIPDCPDLMLGYGRASGDTAMIVAAVEAAPDLGTTAVAAAPTVAADCTALAHDPNGPVAAAADLAAALHEALPLLGRTATDAGTVPSPETLRGMDAPAALEAAGTLFHTWTPQRLNEIAALADQHHAAAQEKASNLDSTRAMFEKSVAFNEDLADNLERKGTGKVALFALVVLLVFMTAATLENTDGIDLPPGGFFGGLLWFVGGVLTFLIVLWGWILNPIMAGSDKALAKKTRQKADTAKDRAAKVYDASEDVAEAARAKAAVHRALDVVTARRALVRPEFGVEAV